MAIAHVQSNGTTNDASSTTIAQAFGTSPVSGNLILVALSWGNTSAETPTVADSHSNTYTQIGSTLVDVPNGQCAAVFYAKNITGGANTVTATFPGARDFRRIVIQEFSGASTTAPLDTFAAVQANTTTTGTDGTVTGNITPANNGSLIWGLICPISGTPTIAPGTGFTERIETASGVGADLEAEDFVQATAASVDATWTIGTADVWFHAFVASFVPAGGGGTDATVDMTGVLAAATAAVVAPPKPRPANPFAEVNVRM